MTRKLGKTVSRKQMLAAIYRYRDACTAVVTTRRMSDSELLAFAKRSVGIDSRIEANRLIEMELSNSAMRMLALLDRLFPADRPIAQVAELVNATKKPGAIVLKVGTQAFDKRAQIHNPASNRELDRQKLAARIYGTGVSGEVEACFAAVGESLNVALSGGVEAWTICMDCKDRSGCESVRACFRDHLASKGIRS